MPRGDNDCPSEAAKIPPHLKTFRGKELGGGRMGMGREDAPYEREGKITVLPKRGLKKDSEDFFSRKSRKEGLIFNPQP
jgi:hypothetical protein